MVTHTDTTLTDQSTTNTINSGTAISMQGTKITYNVGVFLQVGEQPGKDTNQTFNQLQSYGDFLGFKNPVIIVEGVIDLQTYDPSTGDPVENVMTVKLLQEIFQSGHVFTLTDIYDSEPTTSIYRVHGLSGTFPDNAIANMNVMCQGVQVESDTQTKEGQKLRYTLTMTEVRTSG